MRVSEARAAEYYKEALEENCIPEPNSGCLFWLGALSGGYGTIDSYLVHRLVYVLNYGNIPEGRDIHHTCKTKSCLELRHLTAWTPSWHKLQHVNSGRGNVCKHGHDLDTHGAWRYEYRRDKRLRCMECERIRARRAYLRKRVR